MLGQIAGVLQGTSKNYLRCLAALKNRHQKCSFTLRKLRFLACFCLALSLAYFFRGAL